MDLSFWLTTVSLVTLVYAAGTWVYGTYIQPARAAKQASQSAQSVKSKRRTPAFKQRSEGSNVHERSERSNVGSGLQKAKEPAVNVQHVHESPAPIAAPAGDPIPAGDSFTLSPRELVQLTEALNLYREGATVEQAVCRAFSVTKGGGEGYKRAKAIFDAATVAPGAAPAGTYPAAPVQRRVVRRAARRGVA